MKNSYVYPARIIKSEEKICLEFVDFPNIFVEVEDEGELIEVAQEALAGELLDYMSQRKELPKASVSTEDVVYVHVWLPYYKNMEKEVYVKKTVTIPQWLDILAKENNINFSACLVKGIKEELGI